MNLPPLATTLITLLDLLEKTRSILEETILGTARLLNRITENITDDILRRYHTALSITHYKTHTGIKRSPYKSGKATIN